MKRNPNNIRVEQGTGEYNRGAAPIADIYIDDVLRIKIFQGSAGENPENDIIVKYLHTTATGRTTLRQPKHIHWVIDLLMKRQGDKPLTIKFLNNIVTFWEESTALPNNNYQTLAEVIENGTRKVDLNKFLSLDKSGVYDIKFLCTILILFVVEEKTNRADAYMFKDIITELVQDEIDIYNIVTKSQPFNR